MTNSNNRLDRIEAAIDRQVQVNAELFSTVRSLVGTVEQHQENFMVVVQELRSVRGDMQQMQVNFQQMQVNFQQVQVNIQEMQNDIRVLQTENRRILDRIEQRESK